MELKIGTQTFVNIQIPLLWGSRVVLENQEGDLSVVDFSGDTAKLEIFENGPVPGVEFRSNQNSLTIISHGSEQYSYYLEQKLLCSIGSGLPDCQIGRYRIRVARNVFLGTTITRHGTITAVTKDRIIEKASLPPELSALII